MRSPTYHDDTQIAGPGACEREFQVGDSDGPDRKNRLPEPEKRAIDPARKMSWTRAKLVGPLVVFANLLAFMMLYG